MPAQPVDAGSRPTPICSAGGRRCTPDGSAVQFCQANGDGSTSWINDSLCIAGLGCNAETLTCNICIPDETLCDSSKSPAAYLTCSSDGSRLDDATCVGIDGFSGRCKQSVAHQGAVDGGSPTAGSIVCQSCAPNHFSCGSIEDGGVGIFTCDPTGTEVDFGQCYPSNVCIEPADGGDPNCGGYVCLPGQHLCSSVTDGGQYYTTSGRLTCTSDGQGWFEDDCQPQNGVDTVCGPQNPDQGACQTPCQAAESGALSYLGCDYWGVITSNSQLGAAFEGDSVNGAQGTTPSQFAFVVTNFGPQPAHVSVSASGTVVATATIDVGAAQAVYLPWRSICGTGQANFGYHLTSDEPVQVVQFNPLPSSLSTQQSCASDIDCAVVGANARCVSNQCQAFSRSNDVTFLWATHSLSTDYVVIAADQISERVGTNGVDQPLSGMTTIVATQNNTTVQVTFASDTVSTTQSAGCSTLQGNVAAQSAGQQALYTLQQGDVLQFFSAETGTPNCVSSLNAGDTVCLWPNDLTGTVVSSIPSPAGDPAQPIAVFAGADHTYEPFDQISSNHVEEELEASSRWGNEFVGVKSQAYAGSTSIYPDLWRVVSACDAVGSYPPTTCPSGATVTITPAINDGSARSNSGATCSTDAGVTTCTLPPVQEGQPAPWLEFAHSSSFALSGEFPMELAQYFVSESGAGATASEGAPSMVLAVPGNQWSHHFVVQAPNTYAHNYLNVAIGGQNQPPCLACSSVQVDGVALPANEWSNIPGTSYWVAVHALCGSNDVGCNSNHVIDSGNVSASVTVYGYDDGVSYSYVGGYNLIPQGWDFPGEHVP